MSDENQTQTQTAEATQGTPVSKEVLQELKQLQQNRQSIGEHLLDLEVERVRLLAAVQRLDSEKIRIFEGILMERGLPPNAVVEIDAETGLLGDPRVRKALQPAT